MAGETPMTLAEAARGLGVSPEALQSDVVAGRLEARRVGKAWVTSQAAVERYRASLTETSIEAEPTDEPKTDMDATGDDGQVFGG